MRPVCPVTLGTGATKSCGKLDRTDCGKAANTNMSSAADASSQLNSLCSREPRATGVTHLRQHQLGLPALDTLLKRPDVWRGTHRLRFHHLQRTRFRQEYAPDAQKHNACRPNTPCYMQLATCPSPRLKNAWLLQHIVHATMHF